MIKLLIFDFDGTLVDDKKLLFGIIKKDVEDLGYKVNRTFVHKFGDAPLRGALKIIRVNERDIHYLDNKVHAKFFANAKKIKVAENVSSLKKIRQEKIIVTNSISSFVKVLLKKMDIDFFDNVYGPDNFKNKIIELKLLMKQRGLKGNQVIYLGDRPIDTKIARKDRCISVLVSHKASWSPKKDIIAAKPDFIIDDLKELKNLVDSII